jgi:hypothetical protein
LGTLRLAPLVRAPSDSSLLPPTPWNEICEIGETASAWATEVAAPAQSCTRAKELRGIA